MKAPLSVLVLSCLWLSCSEAYAQLAVPKAKQQPVVARPASPTRTPARSIARPVVKAPAKKKAVVVAQKPAIPPKTAAPKPPIAQKTQPVSQPPAPLVNQQAEYDRMHQTQATAPVQKQKKAVSRPVNPTQQPYPETGNDPAFGLKGGLALMTQTTSGQASTNKTWLMGYQGGIFLQIASGDHFSLQPELNYIQKGIRYAYNTDYDQLKATYIDLPILAKVHVGTGRLTANVFAGPYVGYWWMGKLENQTDTQKLKLNYEFDSDKSDGYADNRLDYGAIGGLGVSFSTGNGYILLEGRYQYGLADLVYLSTKPDGYVSTYNRGFQASIGYAIKF